MKMKQLLAHLSPFGWCFVLLFVSTQGRKLLKSAPEGRTTLRKKKLALITYLVAGEAIEKTPAIIHLYFFLAAAPRKMG